MGGDDLGDDDDYLLAPVVADNDDDDDEPVVSKRTLARDEKEEQKTDDKSAAKKRKVVTNTNQNQVLIEAGCGIESSPVDEQLSFLQASLKHYSLLAVGAGDNEDAPNVVASSSLLTTKSLVSSTKDTLTDRLREVVSLKRLKKHRDVRSPAVIIVAQSARRAVAVLKELTPLHLRATKLFPKNGEVAQQVTQLRQTPFPLAVGTPHRLAALCAETKGLDFSKTQLVVLDTFVSKKQYTVCTLPDTAADTMALLKDHVIPQMKTNKNLKLAFL
eukprot:scaffold13853_cov147-Amphora_coffeaeformis.AAC.3